LILYINQLFNFSLCYSAPLKADKRQSAVFGYKTDEFVEVGLTRVREMKMYLEEVEYKHAVDETAVLK
jgi:hypothetical protein